MTKKGKANEEVQAAAGSEAGATSAETAATSDALGQVGAVDAAGATGDELREAGVLPDANASAGETPALPGADGGVSDGLAAGGGVLAVSATDADGDAGTADSSKPASSDAMLQDQPEPGAVNALANDGEHENADGPIDFGDMNLDAAVEVYQAQLLAGAMLIAYSGQAFDGDGMIGGALDEQIDDTAYPSMATFVRRIGRRATPEVLASHLHLEKHRATAEASRAELLAYRGFITTLLDLDDLKTTLEAESERARAKPAPVAPTPIEDTTLEPIDGFFTPTW